MANKSESVEIADAYQFCPRCGTARTEFIPARPFHCSHCGFTSFFGPVTAVGGILIDESDRVLLIERAREPGKGKLGMPGGFVDPYETAEESLRREVLEEVGVKIHDLQFLMTHPNRYCYQGITCPVLDIFYRARVCHTQVISASACEVSSWMWAELTDEILENMAFESNRLALVFHLQCGNAI